ncbi:ATP phosphoribosyltransferase regulatory subunit [Pseudenhygromyxa sp. WMMC2535]|uniref:ATP phosphoribosyltransferase regulatory subunit n=1 Tax=Pseudenhygromyxa sp. WMMC2535 TaxID=2712867 RepID=UPI001551C1C3|nr:ATP phosphoribosyltransferase regulatory subunit [Pseudenhygromyxa sp. WMMC2535]NVB42062.1 ATP phosphoribosyltransferase regulatory subunit [Pseudenhygromyxa sp. WMMC2535]
MAKAEVKAAKTTAIVDASVFNPLPTGARDGLPGPTRRRRAVSEGLLRTFEAWGYREVAPALLEYFEVLGRGLDDAMRERCVRFIEAGTGELIALRSDVTPQIARMVAQRVGGSVQAGDAMRLCYAATLVRLPAGHYDRAELHQVGVEYVGDGSPEADAELIGLADEALRGQGCATHRFDLAHTGVIRGMLAELELPPAAERELRGRLARKDREGLSAALERWGVRGKVGEAAASLCDLHGEPKLLAAAERKLAPLGPGVGEAVARLRAVVAALAAEHPGVHERLLVDLGEVRGFDYYTGMRLRVWAPGSSEPVVRGGRYDDMLARYGASLPATGFAVDLDALEEALLAAGVSVEGEQALAARMVAIAPPPKRASKALRAQLRAEAAAEARGARARGLRAWIDTELGLEAAQAMADRRDAARLSWLRVDGREIVRERWRRRASGWRQEKVMHGSSNT